MSCLLPQMLILPGICFKSIIEFTAKIVQDLQVEWSFGQFLGQLRTGNDRIFQTCERGGDINRIRNFRIIYNHAFCLAAICGEHIPIVFMKRVRNIDIVKPGQFPFFLGFNQIDSGLFPVYDSCKVPNNNLMSPGAS